MLAVACPLLLGAVELPQADGGVLRLEAPARRIVTLAPHLAELAFAAGAGADLLATVEYSEHPHAAGMLPRVGDAFRLDLERILALRPELVIAWHSGNPPQSVARLRQLGLAIWSVEIRQPGDIADVIARLGAASGHAETAGRAAQQFRDRLAALASRHAGAAAVSYFYQVAAQPLFTVNGEHLISRGLELCGGRNVFASLGALAPQVSLEAVIAADPLVMLAPADLAQPDPLAQWRRWGRMRAVSQGRLLLLPADEISQATPRLLDALASACAQFDAARHDVAD